MSISQNKKRKRNRRALDQINRDRTRIRNMIRTGRLPRYSLIMLPKSKQRTVGREMCRILMVSTFAVLTNAGTDAALSKMASA